MTPDNAAVSEYNQRMPDPCQIFKITNDCVNVLISIKEEREKNYSQFTSPSNVCRYQRELATG